MTESSRWQWQQCSKQKSDSAIRRSKREHQNVFQRASMAVLLGLCVVGSCWGSHCHHPALTPTIQRPFARLRSVLFHLCEKKQRPTQQHTDCVIIIIIETRLWLQLRSTKSSPFCVHYSFRRGVPLPRPPARQQVV